MSDPNLLDLMGDKGQAPREIAADKQPSAPAQNKTEHVELDLVLHYDNDVRAAMLVSIDGDESHAVWLPKSEIAFVLAGRNASATTTQGKPVDGGLPVVSINMPEWLAKDRGLI